jgi:octaprenyl-diphosphate synthase
MGTLDPIRRLADEDMAHVDQIITQRLSSEVVLINQLSHYIINSGGKRLRPLLVVLSSRACGYTGKQHLLLAAIIEFIHTATLLHDDVVDGSHLRRGRDTANAIWGNEASVLVGDFLYSRAFQMMLDIHSMPVMEILADSTNTIAEGEVLQLINCNNADITEEDYLRVIRSKTAKLFEAAARLGALIAHRPKDEELALARYGMHLGTAFQLIDDVLDYTASADEMGKNVGDDLAEGKPTLPLIHALREGTPQQSQLVRTAIEAGGREHIDGVLAAMIETGAIAYAAHQAQREAQMAIAALAPLPPSVHLDALVGLAEFAVNRTY